MKSKSSYIKAVWKPSLSLLSLVFLMLLSTLPSSAQIDEHSYVKNFKATYSNEKIYLSWSTEAGFTCQDIRIQLGSDTLSEFRTVGVIYGVCGSENEEVSYFYTIDDLYPNSNNYIRLELGNLGFSETLEQFVFVPQRKVTITPHPLKNRGYLRLENNSIEELKISFYSITGQLLNEQYSNEKNIPIDLSTFPAGPIIYRIKGQSIGLIQGRLFKIQ